MSNCLDISTTPSSKNLFRTISHKQIIKKNILEYIFRLALWEMIHKTQLGSLSRSNGNNQRVYPAQKEEQQIWLEQHNAAIEVESQFQSDFMDCSMANKPCPDPPNVAQLAKVF